MRHFMFFWLLACQLPHAALALDWKPGYMSCDQAVRQPIARAWRAANYLEETLSEIEKDLKDGDDCGADTLALLERLDGLIGTVYEPLQSAIERLPECEKFFSEGLMGLLKTRSDGLSDRLFLASRTAATLIDQCDN